MNRSRLLTNINPNLRCFCHFCQYEAPRAEFFKALKETWTPAFDDVCPRCGHDDVEVFDARYKLPEKTEEAPPSIFDELEAEQPKKKARFE